MIQSPISRLSSLIVASFLIAPAFASDRFPGTNWMQYETPEQAGFSTDKLDEARAYFESLNAAGAMVIYDGAVLAAWGDVERRFMCHSTRKSFMGAAIGSAVASGDLDLSKTLADLGIEDHVEGIEPLTDLEKTATILDLLKARSGVYRTAAYEPAQNPKPARHSHAPGTYWCYNNWDFNALVTIYQQETSTDFFEDFGARIATPIAMQDYRPRDGYLHLQPGMSEHPAYPFRMSARDMARFGLLYERNGQWGDQQVLTPDWVAKSQEPYSEAWGGKSYGLLWWISGDKELAKHGMYSALGAGGHAIDVLPGADLVLAFRVNTFEGRRVADSERAKLLKMILAAKTGKEAAAPALFERKSQTTDGPMAVAASYLGPIGSGASPVGTIVKSPEGGLVLELPNQGNFDMLPLSLTRFRLDDLNIEISLQLDASGQITGIQNEAMNNAHGYELLQGGDLQNALRTFRENQAAFPASPNAHDSLGEALEASGDLPAAIKSYASAVEAATLTNDPNLSVFQTNLKRVHKLMAETQPDDTNLDHVVNTIYSEIGFDSEKPVDFDRMAEIFAPGAILSQPGRDGREVHSLDDFIDSLKKFSSNPKAIEDGFHERILARQTSIFGDTAQVQVAFHAFVGAPGDGRGNRGIDSISLIRLAGHWRVIAIATEYSTPKLPLPGWVPTE